ncbi:nucleoside deaminase [Salibacterium halotolerans]|uniref:tRNA(Arg) A34 adenosine deaminase TadA n=1 Tax=Salibacterium halotolerans TaxID=1884432 RepID=A0A1I5W251_9BACI|nr:nucleoside deaminase [Salibacterium halotolerans]SFQ13667.1 tRNA(Arg) A34 adenosine deaminase TadA [Salibacterium halotolerans]
MSFFLERAVELALRNAEEGGRPFGAVLVKNGRIAAEGVNELHRGYDVSAHAEMEAIRSVQQEHKTYDLSGYTMYASGEPCPMCLSAMYFTGIETVYYAGTVEEAAAAGLDLSKIIYDDLQKPKQARKVSMIQMLKKESQEDLIQRWNR